SPSGRGQGEGVGHGLRIFGAITAREALTPTLSRKEREKDGALLPLGEGDRLRGGGTGMRVLVVGSGGREHALCWAIAASPLCDKLYCAPGNAGIAEDAECVKIAAMDLDGLVAFCRDQRIDFVV